MRSRDRRETLSLRLTPALKARLDRAVTAGPYRITKTAIIERGMKLALDELESINSKEKSNDR